MVLEMRKNGCKKRVRNLKSSGKTTSINDVHDDSYYYHLFN